MLFCIAQHSLENAYAGNYIFLHIGSRLDRNMIDIFLFCIYYLLTRVDEVPRFHGQIDIYHDICSILLKDSFCRVNSSVSYCWQEIFLYPLRFQCLTLTEWYFFLVVKSRLQSLSYIAYNICINQRIN